jgi:hypothetical protein
MSGQTFTVMFSAMFLALVIILAVQGLRLVGFLLFTLAGAVLTLLERREDRKWSRGSYRGVPSSSRRPRSFLEMGDRRDDR